MSSVKPIHEEESTCNYNTNAPTMLWGLRPTVSPLTAISQDFIAEINMITF